MTDPLQNSATTPDGQSPVPPLPPLPRQPAPGLLERQEAVVALGRRALAPPDPSILMQDAAALLAEMLDTEASGMSELSPDGRSLLARLTIRDEQKDRSRTLVQKTDASGSESLGGYALEVAHPVVVSDLPQEQRFTDLFLRKQGIRSAIAVPLKLRDRSFGSLAACSRRQREFDEEHVLFVETVAHLVATTLARRESEKSLTQQRRLAEGVLETVDALVLVLDAAGQIVEVNPACERITGFSPNELKGRPIWNVFPVPEEEGVFRSLPEKLRESTAAAEDETFLLTKHSQRRRIAWSCRAMRNDQGRLESIIATGVDITERREAEEKARRAEQAAQEARQAMAELRKQQDEAGLSGGVGRASVGDESRTLEAFGRLPTPLNAERRKRPRRSYPYTQRIAPVLEGELPREDQFVEEQCNDIAAGGFSFLSSTPPASETLVVALGVPPKLTHLIAQIVHVNRVEHEGKRKFLIGCNYIGRAIL